MVDLSAKIRIGWSQVGLLVEVARQRAGKVYLSAVERAQVAPKEVRHRVQALEQKLESQRKAVFGMAAGALERATRYFPLLSRRDFEELRHQVEGISTRLGELEKRLPAQDSDKERLSA